MANLDWLTGLLHAAGSYYRGRMEGTLAAEARRRQEELDRLNEELVRSQIEQNKANAAYTQVLAQGQGTKNTAAQQALEGVPAERMSTENLLRAAYDPYYQRSLASRTGQLAPGSVVPAVAIPASPIELGTPAPPEVPVTAMTETLHGGLQVPAAPIELGAPAPPQAPVTALGEALPGAFEVEAVRPGAQMVATPVQVSGRTVPLGTPGPSRAPSTALTETLPGGYEVGAARPGTQMAPGPALVVEGPAVEFPEWEGPSRLTVSPEQLAATLEDLPPAVRQWVMRGTATDVAFDEYGHPVYSYATPQERAKQARAERLADLELQGKEAGVEHTRATTELTRAQAGATQAEADLSAARAALTRVQTDVERAGLPYAGAIAQADAAIKILEATNKYIDLAIKARFGPAEAQEKLRELKAHADLLSQQAAEIAQAMQTGAYPARVSISEYGPGRLSVAQQQVAIAADRAAQGWAGLRLRVEALSAQVAQWARDYNIDLGQLDVARTNAQTRRMEAEGRLQEGAQAGAATGGGTHFFRPGQGGREAE